MATNYRWTGPPPCTAETAGGDLRPLPVRAVLESLREEHLVHGTRTKADLWTARLPDGTPIVVKDFRRKPAWLRWWGWIQIWREKKILRLVADLPEAPRFLGQLDKDALVLEQVAGLPLCKHPKTKERRHYLPLLRGALDRLREMGIVHNDLRGRDNLFVSADGSRLVLLDWAGAVHLTPGSLGHRLLFPWLSRVDESAFLKWKKLLAPETLTPEEIHFLSRFQRWRWLWPFNRKGLGGARKDR